MNIFVDTETEQERYSICKACENFIELTTQCKKCGCFMKVKTKIAGSKCPIDKWLNVKYG